MHGNDGAKKFNVYKEEQLNLGWKSEEMPLIGLNADEDCRTTTTILDYGIELCKKDLNISVRIPREQTQTGLS